jgi:hypothetical protein
MPNAIDTFRAQREAAGAVHERLQEIAALLTQLRTQVDAIVGNAEFQAILQREEAWLSQASRIVGEVRAWHEGEALFAPQSDEGPSAAPRLVRRAAGDM